MRYLLCILCAFLTSASIAQAGYEAVGIASFYSDQFDGSKTASGEVYSPSELTCAHMTLPFGTFLRVTSIKNGNSVVVHVNDRGPYSKNRLVDLSRAAADAIDMIKTGMMEVKIQVIDVQSLPMAQTYPLGSTTPTTDAAQTIVLAPVDAPEHISSAQMPSQTTAKSLPAPAIHTSSEHVPVTIAQSSIVQEEELITGTNFKKSGSYRIELKKPEPAVGFVVQVASLSNLEAILKEVAKLQQQVPHQVLIITDTTKSGEPVYKLAVGPFEEKSEATRMKEKLARKGFPKCFITKN